ncbi:hypothetical protein [Acaryochloris sp. IP29b_bin.148]|uniref:hypothetical protein n=1 Tax=Acaryochloris sp. IP29b_bin.148 TaxID=2969218 RepID=UPI0026079131|nr:hypothetical protein [Acaryochloris sp. IP29b_bin.148]
MRHKGTSLAALSILGGMTVVTISACSSAPTWKDHSSKEGNYSVSMPGTPEKETKSFPLGNGKNLDLEGVQLKVKDEEYVVAFVDFPSEVQVPAEQSKLILATMIKGLGNQLQGGKISQEEELQISGFPCRAFRATGKEKSKEVNLAGRICLADQRMYQILAKSDKTSKTFDTNSKKFLTSFKITDQS